MAGGISQSVNDDPKFVQVVLTVPESKLLIAKAIAELPEIRHALREGKIALKGGTTVSALSELLGFPPLRISGRITAQGTRSASSVVDAPHAIVVERGQWRPADENLEQEIAEMAQGDIFVTGANALDCFGNAGTLVGTVAGATIGKVWPYLISEGITTIIAVGLEKLIPGSITAASLKAGRKRVSKSMGMAVGLFPLVGKVVTEQHAIELLTGVHCTVIASGGLAGAEGATTMVLEGDLGQVEQAFSLTESVKNAACSGNKQSLISCDKNGIRCNQHLACVDKQMRGKTARV